MLLFTLALFLLLMVVMIESIQDNYEDQNMDKELLEIRLKEPTVKNLRLALRKLPDNLKVYLAVDEEENALADDILIVEEEDSVKFLPLNPTMPEDL